MHLCDHCSHWILFALEFWWKRNRNRVAKNYCASAYNFLVKSSIWLASTLNFSRMEKVQVVTANEPLLSGHKVLFREITIISLFPPFFATFISLQFPTLYLHLCFLLLYGVCIEHISVAVARSIYSIFNISQFTINYNPNMFYFWTVRHDLVLLFVHVCQRYGNTERIEWEDEQIIVRRSKQKVKMCVKSSCLD